ncbi:hypothetical protein PR048_022872 [Dryococelus australis]|uniref:Uncharacterized protein n=1 Tax=Dryococelus australis TaxID=614101 RepID=A0ABQ9GSF9_9NEOP|nr:hypothetical protein PR048_022872 [Dryococelus australis]
MEWSLEIWAALNIEALRADECEVRRAWSSAGMQEWGKRQIPEKKKKKKPADHRHLPARFPHAKIRSDPAGNRNREQPVLPHTWQYGTRYLFTSQSAIGSETVQGVSNELPSDGKGDFSVHVLDRAPVYTHLISTTCAVEGRGRSSASVASSERSNRGVATLASLAMADMSSITCDVATVRPVTQQQHVRQTQRDICFMRVKQDVSPEWFGPSGVWMRGGGRGELGTAVPVRNQRKLPTYSPSNPNSHQSAPEREGSFGLRAGNAVTIDHSGPDPIVYPDLPPSISDIPFPFASGNLEVISNEHTNRAQSPAASPDFRKWKSCRAMPLVGGFSRGSPISPAPSFRRRSIFTSITLIGSQDLADKSRPILFTHSIQCTPAALSTLRLLTAWDYPGAPLLHLEIVDLTIVKMTYLQCQSETSSRLHGIIITPPDFAPNTPCVKRPLMTRSGEQSREDGGVRKVDLHAFIRAIFAITALRVRAQFTCSLCGKCRWISNEISITLDASSFARVATQCLIFRVGRDHGGEVVRLLTLHHGEPGSIPGGVASRVVPDDDAGRWVFSGISRFPPPFGFRVDVPPIQPFAPDAEIRPLRLTEVVYSLHARRNAISYTSSTLPRTVVSYSDPTETAPRRVSFRPPPPVSPPPPEQTRDRDSHESARAIRRRRARTQLTSLSAGPPWHPTVEWPRPQTRRPPAPSLSVLFYFVLFIFSPHPPFCSNLSIVQDF